jgi:hypothetical protein
MSAEYIAKTLDLPARHTPSDAYIHIKTVSIDTGRQWLNRDLFFADGIGAGDRVSSRTSTDISDLCSSSVTRGDRCYPTTERFDLL